MARNSKLPSRLPEHLSRLVPFMVRAGAQFPATRLRRVPANDFELRSRLRLFEGGDRPAVAGVASPSSPLTGWRPLSGHHTCAGVWLRVIPEWGEMGIVLPAASFPIGEGALLRFRRERIPRGGRRSMACPGVAAGEPLGRFAALALLRGTAVPEGVLLRPSAAIGRAAMEAMLEGCAGLADLSPSAGGLLARPVLRWEAEARALASGRMLPGVSLLGPLFHAGAAEVLLASGTLRPGPPERSAAVLVLASGAGLLWSMGGGGNIRLRPWRGGPEALAPCRTERTMIPLRASWPTSPGPAVHPSGLLYLLEPGEPFLEM